MVNKKITFNLATIILYYLVGRFPKENKTVFIQRIRDKENLKDSLLSRAITTTSKI